MLTKDVLPVVTTGKGGMQTNKVIQHIHWTLGPWTNAQVTLHLPYIRKFEGRFSAMWCFSTLALNPIQKDAHGSVLSGLGTASDPKKRWTVRTELARGSCFRHGAKRDLVLHLGLEGRSSGAPATGRMLLTLVLRERWLLFQTVAALNYLTPSSSGH